MKIFTPNTVIASADMNLNFAEITDAWTAWTPVWDGLVSGRYTTTGFYKKVGKTVHFRAQVTMTQASPVNNRVDLVFPVVAKESGLWDVSGWVHQPSVNYWPLFGLQEGDFGAMLMVGNAGGTYLTWAATGTTVPCNPWVSGCQIFVNGTYECV